MLDSLRLERPQSADFGRRIVLCHDWFKNVPALISRPSGPLKGEITAPGDKSISHRALIFGALAIGETVIDGLLESEDTKATAAALRAYGAGITKGQGGRWHVLGLGVGGFGQPDDVIDLGNSGTSARLLLGLAAAQPITSIFTGDASLRQRPMDRVTVPLELMGGRFIARGDGLMPITVRGTACPLPIEYRLPVASAQVKSAILLAGLAAPGETIVVEPVPTRDHTEHMLRHFGAEIAISEDSDGARRITLQGQPELSAAQVRVPGDPSSAAFPIAAAALIEGSDILVRNVGLNPLRTGFLTCLEEMGAALSYQNRRTAQGEPVADIRVRGGRLKGIEVPAERAPAMIDEFPVLAALAVFADGPTVISGAGELRVKESDRIAGMCAGLKALGLAVEERSDGMIIEGRRAGGSNRPAVIQSHLDHRIAMAFAVLGLAHREAVQIDDGAVVDTSFPGFLSLMAGLGADIESA